MNCSDTSAYEHEELAKTALMLKKKELKYKLMQASQMRNRAQLEEIRVEANYNKERMVKIQSLANKFREKFIKAAKAAKAAEILYKKLEQRLLKLEKFVADEQMQLTRLAIYCKGIGSQIYGSEYKLNSVVNLRAAREKERRLLAVKIRAAKAAIRGKMILNLKKKSETNNAQPCTKLVKKHRLQPDRLSSIINLKDSFLRNLASYRLTSKFSETGIALTDLSYTHNINANDFICLPDLIGSCTDKSCPYQHKSNYLMSDIEKLADILSYKPSLTGFKPESDSSEETNNNNCRLKLKLYAAKLLSANSGKPVEVIAQNLVKYVRSNKPNHELLVTTRVLPKSVHLVQSDRTDSMSPESNENKE